MRLSELGAMQTVGFRNTAQPSGGSTSLGPAVRTAGGTRATDAQRAAFRAGAVAPVAPRLAVGLKTVGPVRAARTIGPAAGPAVLTLGPAPSVQRAAPSTGAAGSSAAEAERKRAAAAAAEKRAATAKAALEPAVETKTPDATTVMKETPAVAPEPEPASIQVTTPPHTGSSYGGPAEPAYAPPSDFAVPDVQADVAPSTSKDVAITEKRVSSKTAKPSTGDRTALYVGSALGAAGLGYLIYKQLKKAGERT